MRRVKEGLWELGRFVDGEIVSQAGSLSSDSISMGSGEWVLVRLGCSVFWRFDFGDEVRGDSASVGFWRLAFEGCAVDDSSGSVVGFCCVLASLFFVFLRVRQPSTWLAIRIGSFTTKLGRPSSFRQVLGPGSVV